MKKKRRMDEPTRKKKRRVYDEESSDEEYIEEIDIEEDIHDLIVHALEEEDWSVHDIVTLLCNEMKYVVGNYE